MDIWNVSTTMQGVTTATLTYEGSSKTVVLKNYAMTLGSLMEELSFVKSEELQVVVVDEYEKMYTVNTLDSWRGDYEQLALHGETLTYSAKGWTSKDLYDRLDLANGGVFGGWKGGEYLMGDDTHLWWDAFGCCNNIAVRGVTVFKNTVFLFIADTDY